MIVISRLGSLKLHVYSNHLILPVKIEARNYSLWKVLAPEYFNDHYNFDDL